MFKYYFITLCFAMFFLDFSTLHLEYVDCQKENETGRDFTQESLFVDKTNLTLERCMKHCTRLQHSYIALQVSKHSELMNINYLNNYLKFSVS